MAELASGAVISLLGVIRNEARLLDSVQGDVQFIKEEMESMNSFLMHLARTAARGRERDEQVRTWMSQVRLLAQDCNNCLDLYLYRGNPDIHLPKNGPWRYLLWAPWFLRKMIAQHRAAIQLRELKVRASDVGKRRLRYGVEIPKGAQSPPGAGRTAAAKAPAQQETAPTAEAGGEDEEEEEENGADRLPAMVDRPLDAQDIEDYFNRKLADWIKELKGSNSKMEERPKIPSIAIVAPDSTKDARALAHGALAAAQTADFRTVMLDIPKVHYSSDPLLPEDILCYMWRELELEHARSQSSSCQQHGTTSSQGEGKEQHIHWQSTSTSKWDINYEKRKAIRQIMQNIQETMKVGKKIEAIKSEIGEVTADELDLDLGKTKDEELGKRKISKQTLAALLLQLNRTAAAVAAEQGQERKKKTGPTSAALCNIFIKEIAKKLKCQMEAKEAGAKEARICLEKAQYVHILEDVFLPTRDCEQDTTTVSTSAMSEDRINVMICEAKQEAKQEILLEVKKMLEGNYSKKQATEEPVYQGQITRTDTADTKEKIEKTQGQIPLHVIGEVEEKIKEIQQKIEALMKIKGLVDKIHRYLKDESTMIILNSGRDYVLRWEETQIDLSRLVRVAGAVIVATSRDTQRAKEYCSPPLEPVEYSLAGLYHDIVLELTRKMDEEGNSQIESHVFRGILDECGPYEFSMKIFAHALYANRKRSREELQKLHKTMKQVAPKSFGEVAKKMLKFSYSDLSKEYNTCLLYLAIFPRGYKIRRSTLIGRWVVGLITTEDWRWHNSVQEAERCFDVLVDRWLVYPVDIGATGKVKSCTVIDLVHEFITKIAKKQRILETRLSHHLARHFSISNDLHLRGSDKIDRFLERLYESSHLSVLKVLDLEGCHCFKKKQHYIKDICSKILLLKYLSLKRTDVTWLPSEINNLHELEVLDIRETQLPPHATRNVRLLKLKRLLAGQTDPSSSNAGSRTAIYSEEIPSSVRIPEKIEKMLDMEVLSNVKGTSHDLRDIGKLWQLRKLGVAIDDNDSQLKNFLRTISDLHEGLQSLSITLPTSENKGTASSVELPPHMLSKWKYHPKHLKSLSISGTTKKGRLLPCLVINDGQLTKVTLCNTWLGKKDLDILADLPTLHYLRLRRGAYSESKLTFKNDKFRNLKYILVEGSDITDITFDGGAPGLEKIVLPFTGLKLNGVPNLTKLEELELTNNTSSTSSNNSNSSSSNTLFSIFKDAKQIAKTTLRGTLLKQDDLRVFAKDSNIRCLTLLDKSYDESMLTFNKDEFPKLNLLILNCSDITDISFDSESAPKINKIVWSFKKIESLSGIDNLQRLRELEFNGDLVPTKVKEEIRKHKNKPYFLHNTLENQDQVIGNTNEEEKAVARFLCWKHED